jgi:hypothetical protein
MSFAEPGCDRPHMKLGQISILSEGHESESEREIEAVL